MLNMISHIIGGGLGVIVLLLCLWKGIAARSAWSIVSGVIYGASFIQLYTISSVYHGLRPGLGKKVLQVIDHCSIYFFIAGTYTPVLLCLMRPEYPGWAWSLFGVVWGLAALATVFTAIDLKKYAVLSMVCYIGMGWSVIAAIRQLIQVMPAPGLWLMLAGGVVYTIGAVLYALGKKHRYMHSAFHFFVLAASFLQALSIVLYVV